MSEQTSNSDQEVILGYVGWMKTVNGSVHYLDYKGRFEFPNCVRWTRNRRDAFLFQSQDLPLELVRSIMKIPTRKMMGKIFPALEIAVALDMNSDVGVFEATFGVTPVRLNRAEAVTIPLTVETKLDPDGAQPALATMLGEKQ